MEKAFNMHLFIFSMLHILQRCGLGKGGPKLRNVDGLCICDGHLSLLTKSVVNCLKVSLLWARTLLPKHSKKWIKVCKNKIYQDFYCIYFFVNLWLWNAVSHFKTKEKYLKFMYFLPLYLLKITQDQFLRYKVQVPKFKGISVCTRRFVCSLY